MKRLKTFKKLAAVLIAALQLIFFNLPGQSLSFTRPAQILKDAQTDNAPAIVNFKGDYFIAWKEMGTAGNLYVSYLGKHYDTATSATTSIIPGAQSDYAPSLRVLNNRLYLFWISKESQLLYLAGNNVDDLYKETIHEVVFANPVNISVGITAAAVGDKIMIGTHEAKKDNLLWCNLVTGADGLFKPSVLHPIPNAKSKNYPFVISLGTTSARYCWQGKGDLMYYADYDTEHDIWSKTLAKGKAQTSISPAVYHVWDTDELFYIWRGHKNDSRIYYKVAKEKEIPSGQTALPIYFASDFPVSVCKVDENNFLMAFTGRDNRTYLSNFSSYDPAKWMEQLLHPATNKKTLREIVIPGSHDAGMSVLTATGGQQKGTINECNTLTQSLNIEQQLNGGIRMFDMRVGTYNQFMYAKHCSSDCMEDAIGGGYGESLRNAATAMGRFLLKHRQEIILLSFSHFCEKETPIAGLKDSLLQWINPAMVYDNAGKASIGTVPLSELAGKVIISFETVENNGTKFTNCSISDHSGAFINFRREYAATGDIKNLMEKEQSFLLNLKANQKENDLIRLDWQLTQRMDEAPVVCNDFENEKLSPLVNGAMLLANAIKKNKSIIDHSTEGNKYLPVKVMEWISDGTIDKNNKPNILYVDVAGAWITDFCIDLLKSNLYR